MPTRFYSSQAFVVVFFFCSCDCFILKDILQNWSDEDVAVILQNLFKVVGKNSRVLVMETILHTGSFSEERVRMIALKTVQEHESPPPSLPPPAQLKSLMDLTMMAFNPSHSRLRTQEEMYFLLEQAGFTDAQTYATRAGYSVVEVFPTST